MQISVIIPAWEPKEYIYEALESIMDQSFPKERYEVILVLNGTKEPYFSELNRFLNRKLGQRAKVRKKMGQCSKVEPAKRAISIRVIHIDEAGVSKARNRGIKAAKGRYITFLDDDDLVNRDYLLELHNNRRQYGIATSQIRQFRDGTLEEVPFFSQKFLEKWERHEFREMYDCRKVFSTCWGHLIPKKLIGDTRFDENLKNGEDSLFMASISKNVKIVKILGKNGCYRRRIRESSAYHSERIGEERIRNRWYLLKEYYTLFWDERYGKKFILSRIVATIIGIIRS